MSWRLGDARLGFRVEGLGFECVDLPQAEPRTSFWMHPFPDIASVSLETVSLREMLAAGITISPLGIVSLFI